MAWEMVNYNCGHSERQQFYGKNTERERKLAWMERGVCPECYRKQKEEEKAKASQVAAEQARATGLPELVGSEKQIAWAETIRKEALASAKNTLAPRDIVPEDKLAAYDKLAEARKRLEYETSAKWWIDNRQTVNGYVIEVSLAIERQM
jgi:hypothetical protein